MLSFGHPLSILVAFVVAPVSTSRKVSLKVRNFNSEKLKVNDVDGNPIEIAAVVVIKVIDSAKAIFDVDNYEQFVEIQSETALRHVVPNILMTSMKKRLFAPRQCGRNRDRDRQ